jgi:hypothetical protein
MANPWTYPEIMGISAAGGLAGIGASVAIESGLGGFGAAALRGLGTAQDLAFNGLNALRGMGIEPIDVIQGASPSGMPPPTTSGNIGGLISAIISRLF